MKIYSWNVNGIRAAGKKGFFPWLQETDPDIICLQETKAQPSQLSEEFIEQPGYFSYWQSAERKGYSSVAVYAKAEPENIETLGTPEFDIEGRCQILFYPEFTLINAYFPNSQQEGARLEYKLGFCNALLDRADKLAAEGQNVIICGDYNIAHKPIDLARPKQNEGNPGYLPEERAWMDKFSGNGYQDTFRMFNQEPGNYTWWSHRSNARANNVGWRLDYFCVSKNFKPEISRSIILPDITGSDHCPVLLDIKV
jgi:exodeoxyribonuclease III